MNPRIVTVCVLLILCLGMIVVPAYANRPDARGNGGNSGVLPPNSNPHGHSYAEWSVAWWQWMASAPATPAENPVLDETGALIGYNQSGSVWFLAGSVATGIVRQGVIPPGKTLFISPFGSEASTLEGNGETEAELHAWAASLMDPWVISSFVVDGVEMHIGSEYRFQSPGTFCLTVPDYNVFDWWGVMPDVPAGTYCPSVSDTYGIMLAPLSVGTHTIYFAAEYPGVVTFDVTYILRVEKDGNQPLGENPAAQQPTTWGQVKALYR